MLKSWRCCLSLFLLGVLGPGVVSAGHSFENTAIVRTVELGGSLVHVTTTYAVKALEDGSRLYTLALADSEHEKTSWLEAKIKGEAAVLSLEEFGYSPDGGAYLYTVELPNALKANGTANLVVETVQTHVTYPWPDQAAQSDGQSLKYETDLLVLSPYHTAVQRTKIRSPLPQIHSYTTLDDFDDFTTESPVTKSGATITYGPYYNIPPSSNKDFIAEKQKHVIVHYAYDNPMLEVLSLKRTAEISHWGANLNIEDKVHLQNSGAKLKGHFSRLEHQSSQYYGRPSPQMLPALTLHLPAGIHSAYFYDLVGNVSTSHLRVAPSVPKGVQSNLNSVMELRPRYPLMGGWNYSFTLGWDSPLRDYAGWDKQTGKYIVGVPLMTIINGAVVNDAEIKIILPEGATDIDYSPPFPSLHSNLSTHVTYLDTIGRPAITLHYKDLTYNHAGTIYVTYKAPFSTLLRKPMAVAAAFISLFLVGFAAKRVDIRIK
ncbi:oligosaccharyl transferase alpha subunit [Obba rivulosa]|uniref:Dolichyl-diphosphooligosaccharide--protein glycosyltransferase subunit 1 n=1 Tax=Obba rivulosa TaxID=1052685 RepID=A0A8E2DP37_9APHY|nr:oligosaccharyl transferase alpha subunit [Obba rivulosa]